MKNILAIRKIKLQARFYYALKISIKKVPSLYMSGLWLQKAGFKTGDVVTITVSKNCLMIRKNRSKI